MSASRTATTSLRAIRRSVAQIERSLAVLAKALKSTGSTPAVSRKGRKLKLSPARKAALAIQGEYIGHMRHLGARDKAKVKALKAAKGMKAAVALAKKLKG
jgi:hypothetical protein